MASGYDYIIAGGGTAGCVLAARLSEDPGVSVLLLEAGGNDRHLHVRMPAAFPKLFRTRRDWNYSTTPQPALAHRQLYWARGKMLGGCSSINAMIYIRGHAADYDAWRDAGNPGWGFDEVLPYFKKAEAWSGPPSDLHGTGGPLRVESARASSPLSQTFIEACLECGLPRNDDFNGPTQEGTGYYHLNQRAGRRWSVVDAYLRPALRRTNLNVRQNAHVARVTFAGTRATGVEYIQRGRRHEVHAAREVILCGGAIGSPQALMLSGIGPARELQDLGIPILRDCPAVGANLQDHLMGVHVCASSYRNTLDVAETLPNIARFLLRGAGPLTSNVGEAGAFVRTTPGAAIPDLQIIFAPAFFVEHGFVRPEGNGYAMGYILLRPKSTGRLSLASSDALAPPRIDANYLAHDEDLATLTRGLTLCKALCRTRALAPHTTRAYFPNADRDDDNALANCVRHHSETVYHPVGTCRMGSDPDAVVDPQLRVHGLQNLRIADASIMPSIPGGNTHAPTVMIAEKAAELIRSNP